MNEVLIEVTRVDLDEVLGCSCDTKLDWHAQRYQFSVGFQFPLIEDAVLFKLWWG